ncbi:MAG: AAA family ATPase [Candidatus Omnitrophica bacterium]|nr:AAA family ATPase [Candidatus Omnitrophota bacterium]
MYLKELEIFGFKSFPEKAALKFEPGVTVVVGPNGCGKSNILDSIKWALGEQSPKSLRGSKMEDIIFNGTENYTPLNYAEVVLTFSNEDNYLPLDYHEISVTRRLYRSGESQYFINKNVVRLKDIQDLFMGTGIGESTYSFVEQGKIEIFLSYKPEDKRLIFDEASGISKFKDRKKETLKRLGETEENLLRLEDIILEVKRQTRYLERQVEKAKKYKDVEVKLLSVEEKIASLQFADLEERSNELFGELNILEEEKQSKDDQSKAAKIRENELAVKLDDLRKLLEEANTTIISLNAQVENSANSVNLFTQNREDLGQRNQNIKETKEEIKRRLQLQEERISKEAEEVSSFKGRVENIRQEGVSLREKKDILESQIQAARKKVNGEKVKILEIESQRTTAHNFLIEIQANFSSYLRRKQRLLLDKEKLERFLKEGEQTLKEAKVDSQSLENDLSRLKEEKNNLFFKEKELTAGKEELKEKLVKQEMELVELNSCYELLKDLRIKYETVSLKKKVTVIFDEEPKDINKLIVSLKGVEFSKRGSSYEAVLQARVVSLGEAELEEKINFTRNEIQEIKETIANWQIKEKEIREEVTCGNSRIESLEKKYQQKEQVVESLNKERARLSEEFELLDKDIELVRKELADLEVKKKDAQNKLNACEELSLQSEEDLKNHQELISSSSKQIQDLDIEIAKKEEQGESLHKEKDVLNSKVVLLEEEKVNLLKNLETIEQELSENETRYSSYEEEIQRFALKIEDDKRMIQEYIGKKKVKDIEEFSLAEDIGKNKRDIEILEKEYEQLRTSVYNKKLKAQELENEKEKIKDYLRQVYNVEFAPQLKEGIAQDLGYFYQEKETLKKKKESLGEVNLIAIEEYEELKKRRDFLEKQKNDLVTSKENLKKAIYKINRTCRELFLNTFTQITEEFESNFKFLFAGGRARLVLLDKEDVLESGVEIEVQPPGKKLQNVSLLSGGEKALTAIALIFAIFKVKPSPLCVLDEIDAPLDEANVDRFNHLLKKFSSFSQFVLITHSKKTMSNADVLYGVTMQEKGVSKLVSVKLAS